MTTATPEPSEQEKQIIQYLSGLSKQLTEVAAGVEAMTKRLGGARRTTEPSTLSWKRYENPVQFFTAFLLGVLGVGSLLWKSTVTGAVSAIGIDCFVLSPLIGVPAATVQKFTLRNVFWPPWSTFRVRTGQNHRILREIPA